MTEISGLTFYSRIAARDGPALLAKLRRGSGQIVVICRHGQPWQWSEGPQHPYRLLEGYSPPITPELRAQMEGIMVQSILVRADARDAVLIVLRDTALQRGASNSAPAQEWCEVVKQ